ncbi:hypothetical protein ABPG72_001227 [Tetrahymena utriculariae]
MQKTFEKQVNQTSNITVLEESPEWKKTKIDRMNKYQIIRNNFIILLVFNFIDLSGFSFACIFYQWFKIEYYQQYMWVNFLYIKYKEQITFVHQNYDEVYQNFCSTYYKIDYTDCAKSFKVVKNIGIAAFSFVIVGLILHILEIIRLIFILRGKRNRICLKAYFLHPLILVSLSLPILLYLFIIIYLATNQQNGKFSFGPSFYVASAFFVFYIVVLVYYKQQKKRLEVHETMDKLIIELNKNIDQSQRSDIVSSKKKQIMYENNNSVNITDLDKPEKEGSATFVL